MLVYLTECLLKLQGRFTSQSVPRFGGAGFAVDVGVDIGDGVDVGVDAGVSVSAGAG
ncbi:hypothetical protein, partial, partial [Absidia glauca]